MSDGKQILLPISIVLGCVIIGGFIRSGLERQQELITAQDKIEYIGERRVECYDILERERQQADNYSVIGAEYYEPSNNPYEGKDFNDACRVEYRYWISDENGSHYLETDYKSF